MSVTRSYDVTLPSGKKMSTYLSDSVNIKRTKAARQAILDGTFHRLDCPNEGSLTVEKPFVYTDFDRNHVVLVWPRSERHRWREVCKEFNAMIAGLPENVSPAKTRRSRMVFGLAELREKLLIWEHGERLGLSDEDIGLLKVYVVFEHPVLREEQRLRVALETISEKELQFVAYYDHSDSAYRVSMTASRAKRVLDNGRREGLRTWLRADLDKEQPPGAEHWVSVSRWSPATRALSDLKEYLTDLESGRKPDLRERKFELTLERLPAANHLPDWAKRGLNALFRQAQKESLVEVRTKLFERRFNIRLEDDWYLNTSRERLENLWDTLRELPDDNVEGNTKIRDLLLEGGKDPSYYDPSNKTIVISRGDLAGKKHFVNMVRHEMGHAVHANLGNTVDEWLRQRFGWRWFDVQSDDQIDQWVKDLGGYKADWSPDQRKEVREYLRKWATEASSWEPPHPRPPRPSWCPPEFGPCRAAELTPSYWFQHARDLYEYQQRVFFVNYYYETLMSVSVEALALVEPGGGPLDEYAAMSHEEFFAELYTVYQDPHSNARDELPPDVRQWMAKHAGTASIDDA